MSIGMGVMLHHLSGGSERNASDFYGKRIKSAILDDNSFFIEFDDGVKIRIYDDGQSCCETRWISCDDTPNDLVGKTLILIEVKNGPDIGDGCDSHETAFIEIKTKDGTFVTLTTHNEHNGYYGGFGLSIEEVK